MAPFDDGCVAPFFERLLCLSGAPFFCGEGADLEGFVLEEVRDDAVANVCRAAGDYLGLNGIGRDWCWRVAAASREKAKHCM